MDLYCPPCDELDKIERREELEKRMTERRLYCAPAFSSPEAEAGLFDDGDDCIEDDYSEDSFP